MHSSQFFEIWIRETVCLFSNSTRQQHGWFTRGIFWISRLDCWKMIFQKSAYVTERTHFILELKDILRFTCRTLFSGLSLENPGEIRGNSKSVRDSWEKTKLREAPGESGRFGNYADDLSFCGLKLLKYRNRWKVDQPFSMYKVFKYADFFWSICFRCRSDCKIFIALLNLLSFRLRENNQI